MNYTSYVFHYDKNSYQSGTKFTYCGKCILNGKEITLNNAEVTWLYDRGTYDYFSYNGEMYKCPSCDFKNGIVRAINKNETKHTSMIWTDNMVSKTFWYILIMLVAFIFKERIGIWVIATIVWCSSMFKNKE